jgi:hypothetical protein
MAVLQRLDRGFDDVGGRREIRLADAEIDDVLALGREFGRACKHGECVFFPDAVERGDGAQHGLSSQKCPPIDFARTLGA